MVVVRATAKLLAALGEKPDARPPASTTALGDWYATLLRLRGGHLVVAISAVTFLPVVVSGRDLPSFPSRLADAAADVLSALGIPALAIERERAAMAQVTLARTDDRSTLGVLVEFQRLVRFAREDRPTATLHGDRA